MYHRPKLIKISSLQQQELVGELGPLLSNTVLLRCFDALEPETDDLWPYTGHVKRIIMANGGICRVLSYDTKRYRRVGSSFLNVEMHPLSSTCKSEVTFRTHTLHGADSSMLQEPHLGWRQIDPDGQIELINAGLVAPFDQEPIVRIASTPQGGDISNLAQTIVIGFARNLVRPYQNLHGNDPWEPNATTN